MENSSNRLKVGDKVTHPRTPGRVGTVVSIEEDRHHNACTYGVAWSEDGLAIPYFSITTTLRKVENGGE